VHRLVLAAAVVACLAPFLAKPFHIDDPMYIWAAQHIAEDPVGFYDFDVNWHGFRAPMYQMNKNPPLVSFYLALVGRAFGWSETALHLGMMLPALAMALGTYAIAARLCAPPLLAALVAWLTPVALVSGTTVMSDMLMLALWCWAVALWMRGLDHARRRDLGAAGVLLGLCPLTKYPGLALIPLLFAYTWIRQRRLGSWTLFFLIPLGILGAYQLVMLRQYGWNPLADVAGYALHFDADVVYTPVERCLVGLFFLGGCLLPTLLFAPLAWPAPTVAAGAVVLVASAVLLSQRGAVGPLPLHDAQGTRWDLVWQMAVFGVAGLHVLLLAAADLARRRSADAVLLALWLAGVWVFATFVNWTITARVILPAAPAAAILLVRAIADRRRGRAPVRWRAVLLPLAAALAVSLAVADADQRLAAAARTAAREVSERYPPASGHVYFQGAWGFQQYMEAAGATKFDMNAARLYPGDVVVTPETNTNLVVLPDWTIRLAEVIAIPAGRGLTTLSKQRGAGFYAALYGPLPFVFGPVPPERYTVVTMTRPVAFHP
jgi:4-amino-4-deoxy-L-arabinose transferase-like glycosyltransferase